MKRKLKTILTLTLVCILLSAIFGCATTPRNSRRPYPMPDIDDECCWFSDNSCSDCWANYLAGDAVIDRVWALFPDGRETSDFAGIFFDGHGRLNVATTRGRQRAEVRAFEEELRGTVIFWQFSYSWNHLVAVKDAAMDATEPLEVSSSGAILEERNQVEIIVPRDSLSEARALVESHLRSLRLFSNTILVFEEGYFDFFDLD